MIVKLQSGAFYGATSRTVAVSGFRFTEKSYTAQCALPRHAHERAHFCFVLAGNYTEQLGGRCEERNPSALIFYPPDMPHAENHHTQGRHFLIELEHGMEAGLRDYGLPMTHPASLSDVSSASLVTRLYREFRDMDELSTLALEGVALELVVEALRRHKRSSKRQPPKWLDDARQILQANFARPPGLDTLARAVGVHPVHLVRVFRKFQRCTTSEYIRQLRVEYARQRMLTSDDSLVEIALSSGFADHTHFSRSFKRVTGVTPSKFRQIARRR
jgi:AraC family transcriptional regulator